MNAKVKSRALLIILTICMIVCTMPLNGVTAFATDNTGNIEINEANFPDPNFRDFLKNYDFPGYVGKIGEDGILTQDELGKVQGMYISDYTKEVKDITGIEYFYNLVQIYLTGNQVVNADFSQNTKLSEIWIDRNKLESINISGLTKLARLSVSENENLTTLDVTTNTGLVELSGSNTAIKSMNVTNNTNLKWMTFNYAKLESIDVTKNSKLIKLDLTGNKLNSIDVSQNTLLRRLWVDENNLTTLDVSKNLDLGLDWNDYYDTSNKGSLYYGDNHITSIDVNANTNLTRAYTSNNTYDITTSCDRKFDLTTLPVGFDVNKTSSWTGGSVSGNILTVDADASKVTYKYAIKTNWNCNPITLNVTVSDHTESDWIVDSRATTTQTGHRHTVCTKCGATVREEDIPMLDDPNSGLVAKDTVVEAGAPETVFNNDIKELRQNLLTSEETNRVADGESAKIYLEVKDINDQVSAEDKNLAEAKANQIFSGDIKLEYLDISLFKQIGNDAAQQISNAACPISVTITIPENIRANGREYRIVRIHDGVSEIITGTYNAATGEFTFQTDKFSTYAIAYYDVPASDGTGSGSITQPNTSDSVTATPKTGDDNVVWLWLALVVIASGILLGLNIRGKSEK